MFLLAFLIFLPDAHFFMDKIYCHTWLSRCFFIYFTAVSYTFDVKVENKIQIVITWSLIIASAILDSN